MKEVKETSTDSTDAPTDTEETNTDILPSKEQATSNKKKKIFLRYFWWKASDILISMSPNASLRNTLHLENDMISKVTANSINVLDFVS